MTTVAIFVYLADVLQNARILFVWGGIFGIGWFLAQSFVSFVTRNDYDEKTRVPNPPKWTAIIGAISFLIVVVIPQEKTMYIMAGAQIADNVAETVMKSDYADKLKTIVDAKLDELVDDVTSKKDKK